MEEETLLPLKWPNCFQKTESRELFDSSGGLVTTNAHRFTVAQGKQIYETLCASCHGERGQGIGPYPALVGGNSTLASTKPVLTVGSYWPYATTVWDFICRTMPYQKPGSLTVDQTYSHTAFILFMNGIVDEKTDLGERHLAQVKMPNRDGFIPDPNK